jgi:cytochrome P450
LCHRRQPDDVGGSLRSLQRTRTPAPRSRPLTLRVVELLILGYACAQALSIALRNPLRRDFRAHIELGLGVAAVAALLSGLAVVFAVRWPVVLHGYALLAALAVAGASWRARPGFGLTLGWPAGSLGVGASLDAIGDRHYYQDQARLHGPIFKMSQFGRPVLCVLGLGRARDLLLGNSDALASASLPYNRFIPKGSLRYMSAAEHQTEAPLFRSALGGLDLEVHEDSSRAACRRSLSRLAADSQSSNNGVEPREYLRQWVFITLSGVFLGLEPDDPRLPQLDDAQNALRLDRAGGSRWRKKMEEAFVSVTGLMRQQAAAHESDGQTLTSTALGAVLAADPSLLESEARTRNLILIFRLAVGDVTGLLDWILTKLSENPTWQEAVHAGFRADGGLGGMGADDTAARVVLETLRMEQSEYLYRSIVRPLELEGFRVPAGWLLRICVQESHRDPQIFPEPDTFDPDRFVGRMRSRKEYSPFGADDRGCMGVPMVHFLGRIFVEELCRDYDCRVTLDRPIEKGTRHRDHWHPSPSRRIALTPAG